MRKFSKKLIAVILSALMIFSSLPMVAFADIDSVDSVDAIKTDSITEAMASFVTYLNNVKAGKVYTNMSTAYEAYVDAYKAYDAYTYGGDTSVDLTTATTNLTTAISNMKEWTQPSFDAVAYHSGNGENNVATNGYSNVVYASTTTNFSSQADKNYLYSKIAVPNVMVYAYDGVNAVYGPIVYETWANGSHSQKINYVSSGSSVFGFTQNWAGYQSGNYQKWPADNIDTADSFGYDSDHAQDTSNNQTNTSTHRFWWNRLTYLGSGNTTDYYDKESNITFTTNNYKNYLGKGYGTTTLSSTMTHYVINYAPVLTGVNSLSTKLQTALTTNGTGSYTQGGLSDILKNLDYLTADNLNPKSYTYTDDTASTQVEACATAIKTAMGKYDSSVAVGDADGAGYQALRDAITTYKGTYNNGENLGDGVETGYSSATWSKFIVAYASGVAFMKNLTTSGYGNNASAQSYADEIISTKDALVLLEKKLDTTEIETIIDEAQVALDNYQYFEYDKINTLSDAVDAAKEQIWSSVDLYKNDAAKITDSTENEELMASLQKTIISAGRSLTLDYTAPVTSLSGYSLNDVITEGESYNTSDYANGADLTMAITEAKSYKDTQKVIDLTSSGSVQSVIDSYIAAIQNVVDAINNLKPSFSNLENGTIINAGESVDTTIDSSAHSGYSTLTFRRPDNVILFRTNHDTVTLSLVDTNLKSQLIWSTNQDYDNYLDSFSLMDTNDSVGEINSSGTTSTVSELGSSVTSAYNTSPQVSANGGTFKISNIYETDNNGTVSNNKIGNTRARDSSGNYDSTGDPTTVYSTDNYCWDDDLAVFDGNGGSDPVGVLVKSGSSTKSAFLTTDFSLYLYQTSKLTLSAGTVPTSTTYAASNYFGMCYYWSYSVTARNWKGYSHDRTAFTETATVIDVSYLFDLIDQVEALDPLAYTTSSYADLVTALSAAKAEMDYYGSDADTVLAECKTRYSNLWTAYKNLETPASNQSIKDAIASAKDIYEGHSSIYSTESWTNFSNAYLDAIDAINGIYSDINVRDIENTKDNQAAIDAVAQQLTDAMNALQTYADFTKLLASASTLVADLKANEDTNLYSKASLQSIADTLADLHYLNLSDSDQKLVYTDEQDDIDAEQKQIEALTASTSDIDTSTIEAAVKEAKTQYADPDAWKGLDEVVDLANNTDIYDVVDVYGTSIKCVKYSNMDEVNAAVSEILSAVTPQDYTVTVLNPDGSTKETKTFNYGDTATFQMDEKVDWYYEYTSNTAHNASKYYTTDKTVNFVVKGNTILTTKAATDTETVKVTYVLGCKNSHNVFAVDYVTKGSTVSELPTTPSIAYYDFNNFTTGSSVFTTSTVINSDITVVANYDQSDDSGYMFDVGIINEDGDDGENDYEAYYNDEIVCYREDAYCWTVIDLDNYDEPDSEVVVYYGNSYTFRAYQETYVYSYSKEEYEERLAQGVIDTSNVDDNNASVITSEDLVITDSKFSMISTFVLPEDCTLVESGILFSSKTDAELKLENVSTANKIVRMKSSQHTLGNQYVISVDTTNLSDTLTFSYCGYVIYTKDGVTYTQYSRSIVKTNADIKA